MPRGRIQNEKLPAAEARRSAVGVWQGELHPKTQAGAAEKKLAPLNAFQHDTMTRRSMRVVRLMQLRCLLEQSELSRRFPDDVRCSIWRFVWEDQGLYVVELCDLSFREPRIKALGVYKRLNALSGQSPGAFDAAWAYAAGQDSLCFLSSTLGRLAPSVDKDKDDCSLEFSIKYLFSGNMASALSESIWDDVYVQQQEVRVRRLPYKFTASRYACVVLQEFSSMGWSINSSDFRTVSVVSKDRVYRAARDAFDAASLRGFGDATVLDCNKVACEKLFGSGPVVSGSRSPSFGKCGLLEEGDFGELPRVLLSKYNLQCATAWAELKQPAGAVALRLRQCVVDCLVGAGNEDQELLVWSEMHRIQ